MRLNKFIDSLYDSGWKAPLDAQHTEIEKLWRNAFPVVSTVEDELKDANNENNRLSRQLAEAVKALEDITRSTIMPPDPIAHSWEAFGRSAMALATEKQFKAINALKLIRDIGEGTL
jgi:hypothetical protein